MCKVLIGAAHWPNASLPRPCVVCSDGIDTDSKSCCLLLDGIDRFFMCVCVCLDGIETCVFRCVLLCTSLLSCVLSCVCSCVFTPGPPTKSCPIKSP